MKKLFFVAAIFVSLSAQSQSIKKVISYTKGMNETRILTLLSNSTMWWTTSTKPWTEVSKNGLPANAEIIDIEDYQKTAMMGTETRLVILLKDNSIWWLASEKKGWEKIQTKGLPSSTEISDITVYVKNPGSMGENMRLVAVMKDDSIWWFAPNAEWQKLQQPGLPLKP